MNKLSDHFQPKWVMGLWIILIFLGLTKQFLYGAPPSVGTKQIGTPQPQPLSLESRSAVLVEPETGSILYEYNADEKIPPASLTKILTLYIVFEALEKGSIHLDDEVYVSHRAWKTGGSQMFIEVGRKIPLNELIKGIAVVSGNDACVAVAEHIAGTVESFVSLMNQKAQELGLTHSNFANPHGLPDPQEYSTAKDLAKLAVAYVNRFPHALSYHSMRDFTFNNILQYNRNHLLNKDPSVDGLKTGFVAAGGYHLIATAKRDGMRLIAVVLGAAKPNIRERDAMQLLNYGFRSYVLIRPVNSSEVIGTVRVWKGYKNSVALYPLESKLLLVPRGEEKKIKTVVEIPSELTAPVKVGQTVGKVILYKGDEIVETIPIVAGEDVQRAGFFKRVWHSIQRLFTKGSEPSPPKLPDWKTLAKVGGPIVLSIFVLILVMKFIRSRRRRSPLPRRFSRRR
ncbi:MAG: D-alanyl-D-alanine carboxypeptidase [Syntrophobacterales bacterium]|nr:D-alanyl-D-alanine carboxypeptidase [Syntrophobacterales bacterium]